MNLERVHQLSRRGFFGAVAAAIAVSVDRDDPRRVYSFAPVQRGFRVFAMPLLFLPGMQFSIVDPYEMHGRSV